MRPIDRSVVDELLAHPGDDVVSLYVPVGPSDPRNQRPPGQEWRRTIAKSMLDDRQGADVMFLFGAGRDDLEEHGGVAAEPHWAH